MSPKDPPFFSPSQPDLGEFLSALGGFLQKEVASPDLNHIKFLNMFCRSVGAREGHMLTAGDNKGLESWVSVGMGTEFDKDFNRVSAQFPEEPSPIHAAFSKGEVMAIIELAKDKDLPRWFRDIMDKKEFKSLVAVPLVGRRKTLGVLCGYYHDVCLFDRGTLNHISMIGRMLGSALEKEGEESQLKEAGGKSSPFPDAFLQQLTRRPFSKSEVYKWAVEMLNRHMAVTGGVVGSIAHTKGGLAVTILAGVDVPASAVSSQFGLPPFLIEEVGGKKEGRRRKPVKLAEWQALAPIVKEGVSCAMGKPLIWENKIFGCIVVWRPGETLFDPQDELTLERIANITAIALNT